MWEYPVLIWIVKLQTLRLCPDLKSPLQPPLFHFSLHTLLSLNWREASECLGVYCRQQGSGQKLQKCEESMTPSNTDKEDATSVTHHLHLTVTFSPPCCFNQFTYDIRANKMETSFQYCQINIDLYSFFSATYYLPIETVIYRKKVETFKSEWWKTQIIAFTCSIAGAALHCDYTVHQHHSKLFINASLISCYYWFVEKWKCFCFHCLTIIPHLLETLLRQHWWVAPLLFG